MKRLQPFLACYLALCLVGGGAVALNPALHRLVEHGGQGAAHTHFGPGGPSHAVADPHDHGDGNRHRHVAKPPRPQSLFAHHYAPAGESIISLDRILTALAQLLDTTPVSDSVPADGHQHDSLFQWMASGLVDQSAVVPILSPTPAAFAVCSIEPRPFALPSAWDAQTASRGPPA